MLILEPSQACSMIKEWFNALTKTCQICKLPISETCQSRRLTFDNPNTTDKMKSGCQLWKGSQWRNNFVAQWIWRDGFQTILPIRVSHTSIVLRSNCSLKIGACENPKDSRAMFVRDWVTDISDQIYNWFNCLFKNNNRKSWQYYDMETLSISIALYERN